MNIFLFCICHLLPGTINNPHIHTPDMLYSSSTAGHAHATSMHRMVTVIILLYRDAVHAHTHEHSHDWGHASDTKLMQPYHVKYCRVCAACMGAISIYNYDPDIPF